MSQQALSPLVQVKQTPILVFVHLHMAIIMLHWHMHMPFIMQQHEHMPPASILHMFCSVTAETSSSHVQVIFMPPVHFSSFISQRGTMAILPPAGIMAGIPPMGMVEPIEPIGLIIARSNIIAVDIGPNSFWLSQFTYAARNDPSEPGERY